MLFNSYIFIFAYLPVTLLVFFALGSRSPRCASTWLTAASLVFYGWWNPRYVVLLLTSIIFNYAVGISLAKSFELGNADRKCRFLTVGVSINLLLLAYFKYMNFFIVNLNDAFGSEFSIQTIILPLGISFFTFTQIAYLIDASRGMAKEYDFIHYCLFVSYFPHLLAGPVLHHQEMMPQFSNPQTYKFNYHNLALGLSLFVFGLFKKLILADSAAVYVGPVFDAAEKGVNIHTLEAWGCALCYTLQIYFDFSGYTDMAIGSSKLFGIKLPINFNSPYKANSIIDFWKCWHISLSRFLRDYLYIPLGGNRRGILRRYSNLLITMLLGGLWHGANWTFVLWGGLHGFYLMTNHAWQGFCKWLGHDSVPVSFFSILCYRSITFIAVVLAWVFFRANSIQSAIILVKGMLGFNGTLLSSKWVDGNEPNFLVQWFLSKGYGISINDQLFDGDHQVKLIIILLLICWVCPNTTDLFNDKLSCRQPSIIWQPTLFWLITTISMGFVSILSLSEISEFIYFQF